MNRASTKWAGWLAAMGLLCLAVRGAAAQERQFASCNCAMTAPAEWHALTNVTRQPGVLAGFADAEGARLIVIMVDESTKAAGQLNERFVEAFEKGYQAQTKDERVSWRFTEVAGLKAYERIGSLQAKGQRASTLCRVVLAGGKCYSVEAVRFGGDVQQDAQTMGAVNSFRFLTPPPKASFSEGYAAGYRVGDVAGKVMFFVGLIVGASLLIGLTVRRNRKATPPPMPPGSR